MGRRIDAHHHLWHYNAEDYGWIDGSMIRLQRDYMPVDLLQAVKSAQIDGTVAVQARQSLEETHFLLSLAEASPFIEGVVGWAAIASPEFPFHLETLAAQPKLKGLRHVVQSEPDDDFILGRD